MIPKMGTNFYIVLKATPGELKVLEKFGVSRSQLHIGKKSTGLISNIRTHTQFEVESFLGDNYPELRGKIKCFDDFNRFFNHPDFEIISEWEESFAKENFLSFVADSAHLQYEHREFS